MSERWMTVQGVISELFGRWDSSPSEATVRRWCDAGLFPGATKTHDGWRIPKDAFVAFLKSRTRGEECA